VTNIDDFAQQILIALDERSSDSVLGEVSFQEIRRVAETADTHGFDLSILDIGNLCNFDLTARENFDNIRQHLNDLFWQHREHKSGVTRSQYQGGGEFYGGRR